MTFHIVELCSLELEVDRFEFDDLEDYNDCELVIGWHCSKERLVVWVVGRESFGFTWFERFAEGSGFSFTAPMNFMDNCIFCGVTADGVEMGDRASALMFYESEVDEKVWGDVDDEISEEFASADRVWEVNGARFRYESQISQYICADCCDLVDDGIGVMSRDISEEIMGRSI